MKQHHCWPLLLAAFFLSPVLPAAAQPNRPNPASANPASANPASAKAKDSSYIAQLLDSAANLRERSLYDSATHVGTRALQQSLLLRDSFLVAMSCYDLGQTAQSANHKQAALAFFQRALSARLEKDQSANTAGVYNDLGYLHGTMGELDTQRDWYLKAMRLYDKNGDSSGMAQTLSNLSGSSLELGHKKDAIDYALKALAIREQSKDYEALSLSCNNLSQIYLQSDSIELAIHYQQEGLRYAGLSGSKRRLAQSYVSMALLMSTQGKNKDALEYEKKAIAICRENGDSIMLARRLISAAILTSHLNDPQGALSLFFEAEQLSKSLKDKYNLRDLYLYRTIFFKERKDFFLAYENYKQYVRYKDSIIDAETNSNIAEIQARYETEKKDKAIDDLRASEKIKDQQLQLARQEKTILIGGSILLFIIGGFISNRYQLKRKIQQQEALLEIRNKIARDLHDDLGSTLTSIQILSQVSRNHLDKGQTETYSLLQKITEQSRQMQQSMSDIVWAIRSDNDKVENMIVRMREYLAQTLEAKNIQIGFQASEELLGYSFNMQQRKDIFLIFKEAVNNAAKYANCTHMDVSLRRCDNRIVLEMKDDGVGFDPETVRSSNGLKNMKARAASLKAGFHIESAPDLGTTVRLDLPLTT
ncbi:MAG: sensor histidine kinase [Bacteroidetes bacterium]|nr:sensor histidine kinase [Bacteroidota bacterium]